MKIKYLTAGESHGPELTAIIEGVPSNFEVSKNYIDEFLARRQKSLGSGGRMNIEKDEIFITSGVINNLSTGGPIAIKIINKDWKNWKDKEIEPFVVPRPGHADLVGTFKYKHDDIRLSLERASARETAIRCAIGAICHQILSQLGVEVVGYVSSIGQQKLKNIDLEDIGLIKKFVDESEVSCPDKEVSELMINEILTARKKKDTLGGSITLVAKNFPAGCGSYVHFDRKLDAKLTSSMMSVQSVKAVEVGSGIEASKDFGTAVQDQIVLNEQNIERITNNLGGFEGGMSTGEPIMITSYLKPISTTLTPIKSVDLASQKETETNYERSDTCAVPRAVPIFESVISIDLLNSLIENTGGDNKELIIKRVNEIKDITLDSFNLANKTWSMKYENE